MKLAEANLTEANNFVDWTEKIERRTTSCWWWGAVRVVLEIKKAKFALEQAQDKKKVLVDYTKRDDQSTQERRRKDSLGGARQEGGLAREKATEEELRAAARPVSLSTRRSAAR